MRTCAYTNNADILHKRWLSFAFNGLVKPEYYGPDLIGDNLLIELKAKLIAENNKKGFDILSDGFNNMLARDEEVKLYALYYYQLKKPIAELKTGWQIYTNIFGREVYFVDFDFIDKNKSEKRSYGRKNPNEYFFLSFEKLKALIDKNKCEKKSEVFKLTTFGLEDKIIFLTQKADSLKEILKVHPRYVG